MNTHNFNDFQHSLDRRNIEFIVYQMSEMKRRGFEPNPELLKKIYAWIVTHEQKDLQQMMQNAKLVNI